MPIINACLGFYAKVCVFYEVSKPYDPRLRGCFRTKKEKTKPKDFAMCVAESKR